jgi:hypothetical protein
VKTESRRSVVASSAIDSGGDLVSNGHETDAVQLDSGAPAGPSAVAEGEPQPLDTGLLDTDPLAGMAPVPAVGNGAASLFSTDEAKSFRARWDAVQVGFVDEPRQAVEQADALVARALNRLAEVFEEERARIGGQWDRGNDVSTEDLRLALKRYRSFFGRLFSV